MIYIIETRMLKNARYAVAYKAGLAPDKPYVIERDFSIIYDTAETAEQAKEYISSLVGCVAVDAAFLIGDQGDDGN